MENSKKKELTLVRILDALRSKVWKAWTDPKTISQWWGPRGVTTPTCEFDAKVGGKIYIVMVMLAGEELGQFKGMKWPMTGKVNEISEPEKLVYESTAILNDKPVLDTMNTLILEELEGGKTKMTFHIVVTKLTLEGEGPLSGMEMGWNQSLDKLAEFSATLKGGDINVKNAKEKHEYAG